MSPFSFFSSIHISDRIEAFREAEKHLFEFAKTRFAHHHHHEDEKDHHFELFDTPIKVPSVIQDGSAAASCQVHHNDDANNYSIHGVKQQQQQQQQQPPAAAPLVLLHGYANGSLYFYRNLMGLSHHFGSIYALDMLGWGMSSRPKFELLTDKQKVSTAESFFVESLESWRKHHNLPKLTLAGHSMGGYISVAYAERYPQHVERLILLSPVGVPEKQPEDEGRINSLPFYIRAMVKLSRYLFNRGVTPGSFLRSLPNSKSKAMVEGYVLNRLPAITCPEERKHLSEYLYQNSMLPGSGEFCLNELLTAGAFAKMPLVNRIPNLQSGDDSEAEGGMEVHMIYGQNDWMDFRGGIEVQRLCHEKMTKWEQKQQQQQKQTQGQNKKRSSPPPPKIHVHGVKDASHLLMLDNYQEFNAALIIASGGEEKLSPNMPRPAEFACDEVVAAAATAASSNTASHNNRSTRGIVLGEAGAADFFRGPGFRGPRYNREQKADEKVQEEGYSDGDGLEEKKVEERQQLA
ncbi:hypothetical protein ACHAXR_004023 [Thalassiosira sp. AJA248-18]